MALLRQLKDESGLTYRQLEARAADGGDVLPRSTLADVLRQDALPRAELLAAFVRACGQGDRVQEWLAARERLASRQQGSPPAPPPGRRRITRYSRALGVLLVLLALVSGGTYLAMDRTGGDHGRPRRTAASGTPPAPAPAPGTYRIRAAISSLCLSERDGQDAGNVYQADCRSSVPTYALEEADGGTYRIRSLHPVFGYGCLGVQNGSAKGGAQMMDDYCGHRGTAESFRLRREGTPAGGYRVMPLHTGACLSVPGGSKQQWAPVLQLPCAAGDAGQVFHFDPVASPHPIPTISRH
ncbi:XRE family transcriptional regulator [Streptomyces sp. NPDC049555]|uniref:RICIN domain-containing protein n=1 Tax=Streptomyces sp. NPDC049555 TaxID=3154930 RepID=UPI00344A6BE5